MSINSIGIGKLLKLDPFEYNVEKENFFFNEIKQLTNLHYSSCKEYKIILDSYNIDISKISKIENIPILPINIFKYYNLLSSTKLNNLKTIFSSGTTSNIKSQIYLDQNTSFIQSRVLSKILTTYLGKDRMPMIVIDNKNVVANKEEYSARSAASLGFSYFSKDTFFALDNNNDLKIKELGKFLKKYNKEKILIFGFTFNVWENFYQKIKNKNIKIKNSILFHGGGWKQLENRKISNIVFKNSLKKLLGTSQIYNYYGMAEQAGSIFTECEKGFLHSNIFNDIFIRDYNNLTISPNNKKGIVQVISSVPKSYPGHSLLTEDEGIIYGNDDCKCGRRGKYFSILGRLRDAELKGCSNV